MCTRTSFVRRNAGGSGLGSLPNMKPKSNNTLKDNFVSKSTGLQTLTNRQALTDVKKVTTWLDHDVIKMTITNSKEVGQNAISSTASNVSLQNIWLHRVRCPYLWGYTLEKGQDRIIVT